MSNSYKYIDPDFTYTDPKTGLLRNLQDIYFKMFTSGQAKSGQLKLAKMVSSSSLLRTLTTLSDTLTK